MRISRMALDVFAASAAGLALYGIAAGLEISWGTRPVVSGCLEEFLKTLALLVFGWIGLRRRAGPGPARKRAMEGARFLSLGLVAIAVFVGAENIAYLAAFPESGVFQRLIWSVPVHLVAALAEALGVLGLLRRLEGKFPKKVVGVAMGLSAFLAAAAWHGAANVLVSHHPSVSTVTAGSVIALASFLLLFGQFLKHAYLGGFLHGAD